MELEKWNELIGREDQLIANKYSTESHIFQQYLSCFSYTPDASEAIT